MKSVDEILKENDALLRRIEEVERAKPEETKVVDLQTQVKALEDKLTSERASYTKTVQDGYDKISALKAELAESVKDRDALRKANAGLTAEISRLDALVLKRKESKILPADPNPITVNDGLPSNSVQTETPKAASPSIASALDKIIKKGGEGEGRKE